MALLESQGPLASMVLKDNQASLGLRVTEAPQGLWACQVTPALQDLRASRAWAVPRVLRVLQDSQDNQDQLVLMDPQALQDPKDLSDLLDQLVLQVLVDQLVLQDHLVLLERMERMVHREVKDQLDCREPRVSLV